MQTIQRVLLVTERPLIIARHRRLLEYAGLDSDFSVIIPDVLEQNLDAAETVLVMVDSESPYSLEGLMKAVQKSPRSRFVLSASCVNPGLVHHALSCGMHGVLSTLIPLEEAALALGQICRGECYYRFDEAAQRPSNELRFSERERTILELLVKGYRNRDLAMVLNCSESNVKMSLNRLQRKTGARSRGELAALGESLPAQLPVETKRTPPPMDLHSFDAGWMFAAQAER